GRQQHAVALARRRRGRLCRLDQHQAVRRERRRAEGAGLDADDSRHQRQRQTRRRLCRAEPAGRPEQGQAHRRRPLRHRLQPERRHHLGLGASVPGRRRAHHPGRQSAGDDACGILRGAVERAARADQRLRPAGHGYRPQRRRLGAARQWPHGELRPQEVQGTAQRPDRNRQTLSGRVVALSVPRTAVRGRDRQRQRAGELLHLGRSVRHVRARQERAVRDRQRRRLARGFGRRQVRHPARALSDGLPLQGPRRSYRRSQRRLEGQGRLVDLRGTRAVSHRRRQGADQQGGEIPAAPRSAGAVRRARVASNRRVGKGAKRRAHRGLADRKMVGNAPRFCLQGLGRSDMRITATLLSAVAIAALLSVSGAQLNAQQPAPPGVTVGDSDLGGVVTSTKGPEAGVWVIAETTEQPTKLVKIVVTDDQGRYVIPELPKATYEVWVRGYGLVDSPKVKAAPGRILNLNAVAAPNDAAAAEYYPAQDWHSMLAVPDKHLFPGTGATGNGMPEKLKSQGQWLAIIKTHACNGCHQVGNKATRTISKALGEFDSSYAAWMHRLQVGPAAENMIRAVNELDTPRILKNLADWTDRIAAGQIPKTKPPRPQGVERNIVITLWDWGDARTYLHDEIATDKRNPSVNG